MATCEEDSGLLDPCGETHTTLCDLDVTNNVWVEGVVDLSRGMRGICMLDSLSFESVVDMLQNIPQARKDLPKVTSNPDLLGLLDTIPLNKVYDPAAQTNARQDIPFYDQFQGNMPVVRK